MNYTFFDIAYIAITSLNTEFKMALLVIINSVLFLDISHVTFNTVKCLCC